jgi:ClpP class serine protease
LLQLQTFLGKSERPKGRGPDNKVEQVARAVEAHPAKVTVYVPIYAMSGETLIALAADEIVLGEFSVLGPIDPQILGLPAASIVRARDAKPVEQVFDLTLVLADVSEKALAEKLVGGHWTHDYALTAADAAEIGLPVKFGMPLEIMNLMKLYPQPIHNFGVEYLPLDLPRQPRIS